MDEKAGGELGENSQKVHGHLSLCLLCSCGDQPSSLAVQGWADPWLAKENAYLHGDSDWLRDGQVAQAKPTRAFLRILDKTSRKEAFSVSEIVGAKDHGSLELPGAVFVTPQR